MNVTINGAMDGNKVVFDGIKNDGENLDESKQGKNPTKLQSSLTNKSEKKINLSKKRRNQTRGN
jgi:hypothetical protein